MSLTNKERGRLDRLKDRCHVLQARLDANTAGKQDWEQELSALSWAVAKIEAFPPEALRSTIIEECAAAVESLRITEPAQFGSNKWGAAGAMQMVCASAIRALKTIPSPLARRGDET